MQKIIKFLLPFLFFQGLLFGASSPETQFTNGVNTDTKCAVKCPPLKSGYFGRIADFKYDTGTTTCYVYNVQDPSNMIGKVTNTNAYCGDELVNTSDIQNAINSNTGGVNSHLNNLSTSLYTNTGNVSYINLPKYMVAGLMAADDIIDIPTSISNNEISLKSGYTISPNLASSSDISDANLISRSKDALAGSVTFVINFLSKSNKILMSFQVAMFLLVVALSLILMLTQKGTKKISQVSDHEDMAEKVLFGVVSILIFFLPMNKIATPSGDISQSGYQQLVRPLLYLGVETADKLTESATSSYLQYKFAQVGVVAQNDIQNFKDLLFAEKQKKQFYNDMFNECKSMYNTDATGHYVKLLGSNFLFPPSETITTKGYGTDEKRVISFYTKSMLNSESYLTRTDSPAVSYCYQLERNILESNSLISNLEFKINNYNSAVSSDMENKINQLTDLTYRNISDMGFTSIVNLATLGIAFDNFSLLGENKNEQQNHEYTLEKYRNQTGYEIPDFAKPESSGGVEGMVNVAINEVITNAPYYMFLPFANDVMYYATSVFAPIANKADALGQGAEVALSWIPFIGNSLGKGANLLVSKGIEFLANSMVGIVTMWILTTIVSALPLIAIIGASFLVISFYFLSVEILYLAIPFASIFAFSTGNLDIIKNLIKQTFILSVKPILIVVSVFMAIFVANMLQNLNQVIISSMFEPIFALSNNVTHAQAGNMLVNISQGLGAGAVFVFLKSVLLLLSALATIVICFYLVFNGANIFLEFLGIKDGGFDVGSTMGSKVAENKTIHGLNIGV